jgi:hypothetical protein
MMNKVSLFMLRWLADVYRFETKQTYRRVFKHIDKAVLLLSIQDKERKVSNVQNSVHYKDHPRDFGKR